MNKHEIELMLKHLDSAFVLKFMLAGNFKWAMRFHAEGMDKLPVRVAINKLLNPVD